MLYIVTFDTEHVAARQTKHYVYHCFAQNAAAAKDACRAAWINTFARYTHPIIPHQFHLHAVRSRIQNPDYLRIHTWRGNVVNGADCLDIFCTDWANWQR